MVSQGHLADWFRPPGRGHERHQRRRGGVSVGGGQELLRHAFGVRACRRVSPGRGVGATRRGDDDSAVRRCARSSRPTAGLAYGAVLCTAGRWIDAEAALLEALGPTASASLGHRADTSVRLAELRLWQGRIEEAAALLGPYEDRVSACLTLARLHFVNGDSDLAAAVIEDGGRGAKLVGDRLRGRRPQGLLVEVELSRGDLARRRRGRRPAGSPRRARRRPCPERRGQSRRRAGGAGEGRCARCRRRPRCRPELGPRRRPPDPVGDHPHRAGVCPGRHRRHRRGRRPRPGRRWRCSSGWAPTATSTAPPPSCAGSAPVRPGPGPDPRPPPSTP